MVPAGPIAIGASAHDTAQITGATATAGGTISYSLFSNNNCTGLIEDLTPAVNTVVNGIAPDSKSHTFTSAGTFYFQATYSGDANNTGPVSSGCAAEPLVVSPNHPSVTTLLSNPGPVAPGTLITDQATLVGATANAGGTVSYAVYSNNTCTTLVQALGTKTVTNGAVGPSDAWTAVTGNFWFQATYSGDANNTGPVKSDCLTEPITVEQPGVSIVKRTNGADANDPNGADVPNIGVGNAVTWTYEVTNTGSTHVPAANVVVTDNQTGVTPAFDHEQTGNGDAIFDPGEVWIYKATGTAINLASPPAGVITSAGQVHPRRHRDCTHRVHQPRYRNHPGCNRR